METEKLVNLDPSDILMADNVRYNLKPYRVESLAENILLSNGVRTPITVEKLKTAIDGKSYRLVVGAYRTAAVAKLNDEQSAGLAIPARVVQELTEAERLLTQVSENTDRENMSPMDKAIAARKMLDAGISKMDIRKSFSAPGGRKGIKVQPASNSHVNMLLSFLDFPKDMQKKIHDGVIGMGVAYELSKYPKDKWDAILERAESARIKELDRDDKDEETFLSQNKKAEATAQEAEATTKSLSEAQTAAETAKALADEKAIAVAEALKARISATKDAKRQATEHYKAAEAELKAAQQASDTAAKELGKIEDKAKTAAEKAQAAKERLEAARNTKKAKTATTDAKVTGKDITKAAKAEGATSKAVKLNATEMREAIKSLVILSSKSKNPKTIAIGQLIEQCFDGKITDGQLQLGISRIVGEEKMPETAATTKK